MNAMLQISTDPETPASDSTEAVSGAPSYERIFVPLHLLRPSKRNVRGSHTKQSIPELAASIGRVGLVQNLVVIQADDGVHFEVVAGGRRYAALQLLRKQGRIQDDFAVACLRVPDASARTISLAENTLRVAMHPADEYEAFAALVKEGRPVEDIAADFGVAPLQVQRRLRLANVSPRLLKDYRNGELTLEQLSALAITDDHNAQEEAFYSAPSWQRGADALRDRLTAKQIPASHPLARFVGVDEYVAVGGPTVRDLFSDEDDLYFGDGVLLQRLAKAKLDTLLDPIRAEGWGWVEAVPSMTAVERGQFQNAPLSPREPSKKEARRIEALEAEINTVSAALDAAYDADNDGEVRTLETRQERLEKRLRAVRDGLLDCEPHVRPFAGAVVTIDPEGGVLVLRGLLRESEAKALRLLQQARQQHGTSATVAGAASTASAAPAPLSGKLTSRLNAHRTAALQIQLARHPHAALAALVYQCLHQVRREFGGVSAGLDVQLTVQDALARHAPGSESAPAANAFQELQQAWVERLPQSRAERFSAMLALPQDELVQLLAVCVAASASAMHPPKAIDAALARAVELDMATWWKPTAQEYFSHLPKQSILASVRAFAPEALPRLAKLKKTDIAKEAERLVAGTGWMPAAFSTDGVQASATEQEHEDADEDTVDGCEEGEDKAYVADDGDGDEDGEDEDEGRGEGEQP